jgi:tRNA-2-methylthio-N6-dimethylallyladenosine synthase
MQSNNIMLKQKEYIRAVRESNTGKNKKYTVITFGCQMNENDSEKLTGMLEEMGFTFAGKPENSDIVVFNTCCVRKSAELKIYGRIGAIKHLKTANPEMILAVCGCMVQQPDAASVVSKKYPYVDLILGTHNIYMLPEMIYSLKSGKSTKGKKTHVEIIDDFPGEAALCEEMPIRRSGRIKAWVPIMYGCDNYCSYCIVPYVRGHEKSRAPEDILKETGRLSYQGYREINLLGQNVNSYGKDLEPDCSFAKLLELLDNQVQENGNIISRIRFMTSHPKDLSSELIHTMSKCKRVCRHLHLPIQAGSNKVLGLMNRGYTKKHYVEITDMLRKTIPSIALTTDVIVGFPGESEEDFEETYSLFEKLRFDSAYIFIYSERRGTPAASLPEQVSEEIKKQRFKRISQLQDRISKEINDQLTGRIFEVLAEGPSKTNINKITGRTDTNKIVNFKGSIELTGQLVNVRIEKSGAWSLEGNMID